MTVTIKPHQDIEVISNIRTTVFKEFMDKIIKDDTESTIYDPHGGLVDILTIPLYHKWLIVGFRTFLEDSVMVNNKTGEFIILQNGVWKYAENCKYRGHEGYVS